MKRYLRKQILPLFCAVILALLSVDNICNAQYSMLDANDLDLSESTDFETVEEINQIANIKENIFNNLLNAIDYYDVVEGTFTTTLWSASEDEDAATIVSYISNIPEQQSYQKIATEKQPAVLEVYVLDGKKITFNNLSRTYTEQERELSEKESARTKQDGNICLRANSYTNARYAENRAGIKEDGMPIYRYRNDLTNADYASVSIFPQTLTFGLLTDFDNWEITGIGSYLDRKTLIINGSISDPVYSEKINSNSFQLTIDFETGIILEFVGYDTEGNESESIRTVDFTVVENCAIPKSVLPEIPVNSLRNYSDYTEKSTAHVFVSEEYLKNIRTTNAVGTNSIYCLIDNDTVDSSYYNIRQGFLAYLNDPNYYNKDMRRTDSNKGDDNYSWFTDSPLSHSATAYIDVDLDIYLYSSTSKDPSALYYAYSIGMVAGTGKLICSMDQSTATNGWNSFSKSVYIGSSGDVIGLTLYPSGEGSTYTGADAVSFDASIS